MRLLLLHYPYLEKEFKRLKIDIVTAGSFPECQYYLNYFSDIEDFIEKKGPFDAVIGSDSLYKPNLYLNLEKITIPVLWIFIDTPINSFWQFHYSNSVDLALCDQPLSVLKNWKDKKNYRFFPLAADTDLYNFKKKQKIHNISFVGRISQKNRPRREIILKRLKNRIKIFSGEKKIYTPAQTADIYRNSFLTLNEQLFKGINLRFFESSACGTIPLSHDLPDDLNIFPKEISPISFNNNNLEYLIDDLLKNKQALIDRGEKTAEFIYENHSTLNRAQEIVKILDDIKIYKKEMTVEALYYLYLKWFKSLKEKEFEILRSQLRKNKKYYEICVINLINDRFNDAQALFKRIKNISLLLQIYIYCVKEKKDAKKIFNIISKDIKNLPKPDDNFFFIKIGDILEERGKNLTPGLMFYNYPAILWNAVECYFYATKFQETEYIGLRKMASLMSNNGFYDFSYLLYKKLYSLSKDKNIKSEMKKVKSLSFHNKL